MDKVSALKALARDKTQSLVDLKDMYDDELLDEIKYNELVEEVNADFEKKKVYLMGPLPVVPETLQNVPTVNSIITQPPVSAIKTHVIMIDDGDIHLSSSVKPQQNDGTIASFYQTTRMCSKSRPESVSYDHKCPHCKKGFKTRTAMISHEKSCNSTFPRLSISKEIFSKFFGQEVDVRLVSHSNPLPEEDPKDVGKVVRKLMDSILNKVEKKILWELKQEATKPRRKAVGEGNKLTTGAVHRTRYTLEFKAEIIRTYDNLKCQCISTKVSIYYLTFYKALRSLKHN